jgi:DNA polymerase-3 subunit gamma/tau
MTDQTAAPSQAPYRVLARKYRPSTFQDLIGQEAMVRTLTNAIDSGRLHHAFILTGVRGVGKTTTARIIAKALNYVGPDGKGGPTAQPTDDCPICKAIAEDRHPDVIEMDAASRTGVGDIRELIESVRYRPIEARYKVYILDEVHMLSTQAFNALLKTLEEPPEHVVFIFATTEIRKVPVTVLSRCQRFDLRRVSQQDLAAHFARICEKEQVEAEPEALELIARAADGSVRDGLSLLDQAIALGEDKIAGTVVAEMLGLGDRARAYDLFEALMQGKIPETLEILEELYAAGADPVVVLQDLLELTHGLTRMKLVPSVAEEEARPETERVRGLEMAKTLPLAVLARAWQMLLKGVEEAQRAPQPLLAVEMTLIRIAHASELPPPGDLVKKLTEESQAPAAPRGESAPAAAPAGGNGASAVSRESTPGGTQSGGESDGPRALAAAPWEEEQPAEPQPETAEGATPVRLESFAELLDLARDRRDPQLCHHLRCDVHLVSFEPGRIELRTTREAPRDLLGSLTKKLREWTGERWVVSHSEKPGDPTLREQEEAAASEARQAVMAHPVVKAVMESFPGAEIQRITSAPEADLGANPEAEAGAASAAETGGEEEES